MNKTTPSRIAIFSSDVMMKNQSTMVVDSTAAARFLARLVDSLTRRNEVVGDPTVSEQCDAQPGLRSLVRWLLRRRDASAATLQFLRCVRRDRQSYLDSTRRIVGLFHL